MSKESFIQKLFRELGEKDCQTCKFSSYNTGYESCDRNPNSPTHFGQKDCSSFDLWEPVMSEMDLLAINSLRTGTPVYSKTGRKGVICKIDAKYYILKTLQGIMASDIIHAENPVDSQAKDDTDYNEQVISPPLKKDPCDHRYKYAGIKFKLTNSANSNAKIRTYFDFFFCEKCLDSKLVELGCRDNTYKGPRYKATPAKDQEL